MWKKCTRFTERNKHTDMCIIGIPWNCMLFIYRGHKINAIFGPLTFKYTLYSLFPSLLLFFFVFLNILVYQNLSHHFLTSLVELHNDEKKVPAIRSEKLFKKWQQKTYQPRKMPMRPPRPLVSSQISSENGANFYWSLCCFVKRFSTNVSRGCRVKSN